MYMSKVIYKENKRENTMNKWVQCLEHTPDHNLKLRAVLLTDHPRYFNIMLSTLILNNPTVRTESKDP